MSIDAPLQDTTSKGMNRRSFLSWSAALGGGGALVASSSHFLGMPQTAPAAAAEGIPDAETVWSACVVNCGSRCPLRLQIVDGQIARVLPENSVAPEDETLLNRQIRACVRGRNMRERVYGPGRIKKPLKRREGTKRGEGVWDEISWDEALQLYADEMVRVREEYGPASRFMVYGSGVWNAHVSSGALAQRLFNIDGGQLNYYGNYSFSQLGTITKYHYGTEGEVPSNSIENTVQHSKMWVLWGHNPQETRMSGGGNLWNSIQAAKKEGLHIVVVDPRHSDSVTVLADEWIAPRPGTDAALVAAIIKHLCDNNLQDQEFLDKYCVGFDEHTMPEGVPANLSYRAYIDGKGEDGIEKTPEWAAEITGVPAETIRAFANRLANTKPVNIVQGWGPQRHANGENQTRAIYTLANALGQVGVPGGGTGGMEGYLWPLTMWFPAGDNPVPDAISNFGWAAAIDHGPEMTAENAGIRGTDRLSTGIKFMVEFGGNMLASQHADNGRLRKLLQDESKCEFICVIDNQMTRSAELADLVLPDCTTAERWDMVPSEYTGDMAYLIAAPPAIEPLHESRAGFDIFAGIAEKLGKREEYTMGHDTMEDWCRYMYEENKKAVPDLPATFEEFLEKGVHRYYANPDDPEAGTYVGLKEFREDPDANPLETPSGKIEIFSKDLYDMGQKWEFPNLWADGAVDHEGSEPRKGDKVTALPEYVATWEGAEEAMADGAKYPIQLIGHHFKQRTHSTYGNLARNLEAHPQSVWINTLDAEERGIKNGDIVGIFNDRGRVEIQAKVTPRIMPGVASLPQGSWIKWDDNGVDHGGSVNVLSSFHPAPVSKGNCQHTNVVQIELVSSEPAPKKA